MKNNALSKYSRLLNILSCVFKGIYNTTTTTLHYCETYAKTIAKIGSNNVITL